MTATASKRELTLNDILKDPKKFGFCTLQEFAKNPDRWRSRVDSLAVAVDNGSQTPLRAMIKKHIYYVEGYQCDSLESAEHTAKSMGFSLSEEACEMDAQLVDIVGGGYHCYVRFRRRRSLVEID